MRTLTFQYHGVAKRELESAKKIGASGNVLEHRFVRLPDLREARDIGTNFGDLPPTYIPLRNSIFYSLAASYAEEVGASLIVGGHNCDDEKVFEDVSPGFFKALEATLRAASPILRKNRVRVVRPLRNKTKAEVVRLAVSLGVPLGLTWSCHRSGREHCWKCDGCLGRRRAFTAADVDDPLVSPGRGKIT